MILKQLSRFAACLTMSGLFLGFAVSAPGQGFGSGFASIAEAVPANDCNYKDMKAREACFRSRHPHATEDCAYKNPHAREACLASQRANPNSRECYYPTATAREACWRSKRS